MRIVLDAHGERRELVVEAAADATVGELVAAAGHGAVDAVTVGGRLVPADHTLREAAVPDGATVVVGGHGVRGAAALAATTGAGAAPTLTVVAGLDAGASTPLDRPVVVGRGAGADLVVGSPTVSDHHCRVVADGRGGVAVTDLGSTNGTWVDGDPVTGTARVVPGALVRVGAVVLRIEPPSDDDRPRDLDPLRHLGAGRAVPFNRPPRPGAPPPVPAVRVAADPPEEREKPPFSVLTLVAPVVMGVVMAYAFQRWVFLLFTALSPVMMLGNWITQRRRHGRDSRARQREHEQDMARFARDLDATAAAEAARRWEVLPSLAEVCRRAREPSTRLWERRPSDDDALRLVAGVGDVPWQVPLREDRAPTRGEARPAPIAALLDAHAALPRVPVEVDLAGGGVVGVVGEPAAARALARALLVQACAHHGPADLPVAVVADQARLGDWAWTTWLPHTAVPGDQEHRRLAVAGEEGEVLLRALRTPEGDREPPPGLAGAAARVLAAHQGERPAGPTQLLVLDAPGHLRGRDAPARAVLRGEAGAVAGIVLADTEDQLPAVCDTVVTVTGVDGEATLVRPAERRVVPSLLVAGLGVPRAAAVARRLAGLEDPEQAGAAGQVPGRVDLFELLAGDPADPADVATAWARTAGRPALASPLGVGADGVVTVDLVRDGPHGLLGGTTGSGKSELLRSLVAGLAATHDSDHLTFVLVDYKGGAAFDACGDLPHVVGLVTDLDEHLGERALRCLEAELEHRERRLRALGVSDLPQWLRLAPERRGGPLPRLCVVIDEFATLKAELPDFVQALVGIAQRGRSLGVHLLLGTQRPSGAVDENVRANSNLRIALRVTDTGDSSDVVGVPDAARIPPALPGRGVLRVGPGAVVPVQTALVTGVSGEQAGPRVRLGPVGFGPRAGLPAAPAGGARETASDLERLVAACRAAFVAGGHPQPRRPWPEPLPPRLPLAGLLDDPVAASGQVPMARVDVPEQQAQHTTGWDVTAGNLLVHGVVGSGTTTTAAAAVLAAAHVHPPDELHVVGLDLGRGELAALEGLPHCGAVVTGREAERRHRLLRFLVDDAARRRALDRTALDREARLVVVVDGLTTLLDELDEPSTYELFEAVQRAIADAPALRTAYVLTTPRAGGLRSALTSTIEQRWTHRLADPTDYGVLGLRASDVPDLVPGRAVRVADGRELQVGDPGGLADAVAAVASRWPAPAAPPPQVRTLPTHVADTELDGAVATDAGAAWRLPLGRRDRDLGLATLVLHRGEHGLVLGPPASGRSGLLGALAAAAARAGVTVVVVAGSAASPLLGDGHEVVAPGALGERLRAAAAAAGPTLVLVDDAERVPDPGAPLDALAGDGGRVHVVAAARAETVASDFSHWLRRVARSRTGAVLRPTGDGGGDLLQARLPRRTPAAVTSGRGWLVAAGEHDFVQFAAPPGAGGRG